MKTQTKQKKTQAKQKTKNKKKILKQIENVEGEYHVMFFEGKNIIHQARANLRYAWFSLLVFVALVALCVVLSGLNAFYIGFLGVFVVAFVIFLIYLSRSKRAGIKQCLRAVENSKEVDIVYKGKVH